MHETNEADKQTIELTIIGEGLQNRERICVKATVQNNSSETIGWDREFSVFLQWQLLPENDYGKTLLQPKTTVPRINQTKDQLSKTRFIRIAPGQSVSKTIELTKPFKSFQVDAWGGSSETRHPGHFEGFEAMERFSIPSELKKVGLRLEYNQSRYGRPAFKSMFGFEPDDVGLLKIDRYDSNELILKFD
jgi:hypothetical protein